MFWRLLPILRLLEAGSRGIKPCGIADPETGGLVIQDKDGPRPNPLLRVVRSAGDTMLQLAREFGLSPIARARLASAGFEPPPRDGKFDGLIA